MDVRVVLLLEAELLVKSVNTSAGIDQLLLAGIEGVALRANVDAKVLLGGAGLNNLSASTLDGCRLVIGMYSVFHFNTPLCF